MLATIISIPDRYTARGLTFLQNGQQFTLGLPAGEYDDLGECDLVYSDLGKTTRGPAVMLVNIATGEKWYVGVQVAEFLRKEHARELGAHPE